MKPANPPPAQLLPVVQADRDRAASLYNRSIHPGIQQEVLAGDRDHQNDVQAFAAHRLAHSPERGELASLVEALENFCRAAEYWAGCDEGCSPDEASTEIMSSGGAWPAEAYDRARAALHALSASPGQG